MLSSSQIQESEKGKILKALRYWLVQGMLYAHNNWCIKRGQAIGLKGILDGR